MQMKVDGSILRVAPTPQGLLALSVSGSVGMLDTSAFDAPCGLGCFSQVRANAAGTSNGPPFCVPMKAVPDFKGIRVKAMVTERVGPDTVFLPFHFSGRWGGVDLAPYYPQGAVPVVRGEAVNTATTYGYDSVTMMQETKTTVCQIERATA